MSVTADLVAWLREAPSDEWNGPMLNKAANEIERLHRIEMAALHVADTLNGGFVVCQNCGDQETTTDLDYARDLLRCVRSSRTMSEYQLAEPPRLIARFVLRQSGESPHMGRMPIAGGDYTTEARLIGDDIEILMFARDASKQ